MKKNILLLLLFWSNLAAAGLAVSPSTPQHTHFDPNLGGDFLNPAQLTVRGTLSSTKACAAGYTRLHPNYCLKTAAIGAGTALARDTVTALTLPSGDAKGVFVRVGCNVYSANAILARYCTVYGYSDGATGAAVVDQIYAGDYENPAVAATFLNGAQGHLTILSATPSVKFQDDAGNGGNAVYEIRGYYD